MNSEDKYLRERLQEKFDGFDVPFDHAHWAAMKGRMEAYGFAALDGTVSRRWIGTVCLFGLMAVAIPFFITKDQAESTQLAEATSMMSDEVPDPQQTFLSERQSQEDFRQAGKSTQVGGISQPEDAQRIGMEVGHNASAALQSVAKAKMEHAGPDNRKRQRVRMAETKANGTQKGSGNAKVVTESDSKTDLAEGKETISRTHVSKLAYYTADRAALVHPSQHKKARLKNREASGTQEETRSHTDGSSTRKQDSPQEGGLGKRLRYVIGEGFSQLKRLKSEKGPIGLRHTFGHTVLLNFWDNPSFTGVEDRNNLNMTADRRWLGLYKSNESWRTDIRDRDFFLSPLTMAAGYDGKLGKRKLTGIGVFVRSRQFQLSSSREYGLMLSRRWNLSNGGYFRVGSGLAYQSDKLHTGNLTLGDMIDARNGFIYETQESGLSDRQRSFRIPVGIWYDHKGFFGSISMEEQVGYKTGREESADLAPDKVTLLAGQRMAMNSYWSVLFQGALDYEFEAVHLTPAVFAEYKKRFLVGASFEHLQVFNVHGGFLLSNHWRWTVAMGTPTTEALQGYGQVAYLQTGLRYQFGRQKSTEN